MLQSDCLEDIHSNGYHQLMIKQQSSFFPPNFQFLFRALEVGSFFLLLLNKS